LLFTNIYTTCLAQLYPPTIAAYLPENNLYTQFKIFLPAFARDIHKLPCTNFRTFFELFFGNTG